ncbi:hypothetical protein UFOVP17_1 [uncultured Caudovirales phage]|uniref:Uncharacterized protein n=1 Tax=uncultured Caudovirales phage TaxID=2100421 RepID=A0A6J5KI35_9CAUD|nr:hypothetical protein UFOVP17_1 [uncultured Caudovirales phage]
METVKWEKWGNYAIKTRGFSISKSKIQGAWLYTLWRLPKEMLGNYGNVNDAKEAHLEIIRKQSTQPDTVDSKFGLSKTLASDYSRIKG